MQDATYQVFVNFGVCPIPMVSLTGNHSRTQTMLLISSFHPTMSVRDHGIDYRQCTVLEDYVIVFAIRSVTSLPQNKLKKI